MPTMPLPEGSSPLSADMREGRRDVPPDHGRVADFCEISAQSPAQRPRARQNETLQIAESHERPAGHKRAINGAKHRVLQRYRQRRPGQPAHNCVNCTDALRPEDLLEIGHAALDEVQPREFGSQFTYKCLVELNAEVAAAGSQSRCDHARESARPRPELNDCPRRGKIYWRQHSAGKRPGAWQNGPDGPRRAHELQEEQRTSAP